MRHGALFNGIGGFQLAAKWCGWDNVFSVEIDKWCNRVTAQHFPECAQYENIYDFDGAQYAGSIDIISGGFPCQPFSVAGKRKGKDDDRHLWPEMLRVIQEIRPAWVCGENVAGIVNMVLDEVLSDLEGIGYRSEALIVPACATNAPHRRDRVWIIAHSDIIGERAGCRGIQEKDGEVRQRNDRSKPRNANQAPENANDLGFKNPTETIQGGRWKFESADDKRRGIETFDKHATSDTDPASNRRKRWTSDSGDGHVLSNKQRISSQSDTTRRRWNGGSSSNNNDDPNTNDIRVRRNQRGQGQIKLARSCWDENWYEVATTLCRVDDGLPGPLDRTHRLKALGNAIVPQVAYEIFQAIKKNHDSKENTCTT
jgi:DNA (cytosine-5)-methyltransferase 1